MADKVVTLDVRNMPPWERHPKIFETFDRLKAGETLKLINDHDPRPLHYEFMHEREGQFEWTTEEKIQEPSDSLRKWFAHRTERWEEFKNRYLKELEGKKDLVKRLEELTQKNTVTLVYSARDEFKNNATILFELIMRGKEYARSRH